MTRAHHFTITLADVHEWFSPAARGVAGGYLAHGLVGRIEWSSDGAVVNAFALVGEGAAQTAVAISFETDGRIDAIGFVCARHGGEAGCEHEAALALAVVARGGVPSGASARMPSTSSAPSAPSAPWQRALDGALGEPGGASGRSWPRPNGGDPEPAAILFDHRRRDEWGSRELVLCIRPAVRGTRGSWIRDQLEWRSLDRRTLLPAHHHALAEIAAWYEARESFEAVDAPVGGADDRRYGGYSSYYGYGVPQWIPLEELPGRSLWSMLDQAREAGVELVSADRSQRPVHVAPGALTAAFDAEVARGRLRITPRFAVGAGSGSGAESMVGSDAESMVGSDAESMVGSDAEAAAAAAADPFAAAGAAGTTLAALGTPMVGVAVITESGPKLREISLHRFAGPVDPAFDALRVRGTISIPATDRPGFERDYLDRLRAIAPISSRDGSYTPPPPVEPELVLHATDEHPQLRMTWSWDYGDRGPAARNPAAEVATVARVLDAVGARAELIGPAAPDGSALPTRLLSRAHAIECVAEVLPVLRALDGVRVVLDERVPEYRFSDELPTVAVSQRSDGTDWFELDIEVSLAGEAAPFAELFVALSEGHPYFALPSGLVIPLDLDELQQLRDLIDESRSLGEGSARGIRVNRYQVDFWQHLVELGIVQAQSDAWFDRVRALSHDEALTRVDPPSGLHAELREYQQTGYAWLDFLQRNGLGGILADDMGLGKTVQALAMIAAAHEQGRTEGRPFLVVAPTSVVGNWAKEAARFTPGLRVVELTATAAKRGQVVAAAIAEADLVVTSYAILRLDADQFADERFAGLILDEAQQVKNAKSKTFHAAKRIDAASTFVVTGTPIENDLSELWALATLACPGLLGGPTRFTEYYRRPIERERDSERLAQLRSRLRPFMLRRTKDAVAADLPPKTEQVLTVELDSTHRRIYDRRLQRERQKVLGLLDDVESHRFQILQSLTRLRRLALDPAFDADDPLIEVDGEFVDGPDASGAPLPAKLRALAELVEEVVAEGHKVLVFSQFTGFLRRARDTVAALGIAHAYLDGSVSAAKRRVELDRFAAGEASVFLISLKAGGFGLNLTEADYCILLDPWWNPAAEAQAVDRTHRIGQTRPVMVYRLISGNTVEAKVLEKQESKRALYDAVLGDAEQLGALTADDIRGLIE